jgi:hypothetical protein
LPDDLGLEIVAIAKVIDAIIAAIPTEWNRGGMPDFGDDEDLSAAE